MKKIPEEIASYIIASSTEPAMEENAIFDAVVDIAVQGGATITFMTWAPLDHALYYLSMATIYDACLDRITGLREQMREYDKVIATIKRARETEEDEIYNKLVYIKDLIGHRKSGKAFFQV